MLHELEGNELSFKKLYSSVNHSDIGLRNHLMKLKDGGWISINESKKDARSKIISATDKLHKTYERLDEALRKNG
jgi:DNA-binding MarR family transcriptional regulator